MSICFQKADNQSFSVDNYWPSLSEAEQQHVIRMYRCASKSRGFSGFLSYFDIGLDKLTRIVGNARQNDNKHYVFVALVFPDTKKILKAYKTYCSSKVLKKNIAVNVYCLTKDEYTSRHPQANTNYVDSTKILVTVGAYRTVLFLPTTIDINSGFENTNSQQLPEQNSCLLLWDHSLDLQQE